MSQAQMGTEIFGINLEQLRKDSGLPEVDLIKAYQEGGLPEVQRQAALAASQTSLFQNILTGSSDALKNIASSKAGIFVMNYKLPIAAGLAVLFYLAFFHNKRPATASNPRPGTKHKRKRKAHKRKSHKRK